MENKIIDKKLNENKEKSIKEIVKEIRLINVKFKNRTSLVAEIELTTGFVGKVFIKPEVAELLKMAKGNTSKTLIECCESIGLVDVETEDKKFVVFEIVVLGYRESYYLNYGFSAIIKNLRQ